MNEDKPEWVDELINQVKELKNQTAELKNQVGKNCTKLDNVENQINNFYRSFGREISKIQLKMGVDPFQHNQDENSK